MLVDDDPDDHYTAALRGRDFTLLGRAQWLQTQEYYILYSAEHDQLTVTFGFRDE